MKYQGSKIKIGKKILEKIARDDELWIEPFVGGCGMIRHVKGEKIGADNNKYMIALWQAVQNGYIPPKEVSKELYNDVRDNKDNYPDELVGFIGAGCSFGGGWFNGYSAPVSGRNYVEESYRAVLKLSPLIKDVKFIYSSYNNLSIPPGSIIYCDPPYKNTKGYKESFNHDKFWEWCRKQSLKNRIYISEYEAPEDFTCILEVSKSSTMDSYKTRQSIERLFTLL